MSVLNLIIILELIANAIFWWLGIFIFFQNPKKRLNQTIAGFLIAISTFYSSDILSSLAPSLKEYTFTFRAYAVGIYLAVIFLYHSVYLSTNGKNRLKLSILLYFAYLGGITSAILDGFTNFVVDYSYIRTEQFWGNWIYGPGPLLYAVVVWGTGFVIISGVIALYDFYINRSKTKEIKVRYLLIALAFLLYTGAGVSTGLHYYRSITYFGFLFNGLAGIGTLTFALAIIFYGFLIKEPLYKNKVFQHSSLTIGFIVVFYTLLVIGLNHPLSYSDIIFLLILIPAIITSHYLFDWLNNLARNIIYSTQLRFSVANDLEVGRAIRYYYRPVYLEDSPLLKLEIVQKLVAEKRAIDHIDAIRNLIKETIDYLKPADKNRRTKQSIKYHILFMLAFDQAEEGQMLWELGFEEYPVRIMSQEGKSRPPKLRITSPADYTATSRNAFINLKQEAIHDVTWRISYLEKLAKRQ